MTWLTTPQLTLLLITFHHLTCFSHSHTHLSARCASHYCMPLATCYFLLLITPPLPPLPLPVFCHQPQDLLPTSSSPAAARCVFSLGCSSIRSTWLICTERHPHTSLHPCHWPLICQCESIITFQLMAGWCGCSAGVTSSSWLHPAADHSKGTNPIPQLYLEFILISFGAVSSVGCITCQHLLRILHFLCYILDSKTNKQRKYFGTETEPLNNLCIKA